MEGGLETAAQSAKVAPGEPEADLVWIATSPFQPGLVWRVVRDGVPGSWSAPVAPADGLVITVGTTTGGSDVDADGADPMEPDVVVVEGIELRPDPADPAVWTYVPPGPLLERGPDGTPAISLLDAGTVTFLQVTCRLDLLDEDRSRVLASLRQKRPSGPTSIRPHAVNVRRVALQVKPTDGGWATVAEGASSGNPPWTTALSASLTTEQTLAVEAAISGTPDRARLTCDLTVPADAALEADRATSASLTFTNPAGSIELGLKSRSTRVASGTDRPLSQANDVANLFPSL